MNTEIIAFILGVSLASERLIELIKTLFPGLAYQHSLSDENTENLTSEKSRRIVIQLISVACGYVSAAILGDTWTGNYTFDNGTEINVFVLGVLSSGGSVFWTQILGYSKALKDLKKLEARSQGSLDARVENINLARYQNFIKGLDSEQPPKFGE